jgi:hypothetical protein
MRIKPKPLAPRGLHTLADGATCLAAAPAPAGAAHGAPHGAAAPAMLVAAGGYDDEIVLLDLDLNAAARLPGHAGGTNALAFAGPARLVSAGEDGTAAVWDCRSHKLAARLACEGVDADRCGRQ